MYSSNKSVWFVTCDNQPLIETDKKRNRIYMIFILYTPNMYFVATRNQTHGLGAFSRLTALPFCTQGHGAAIQAGT